MKAPTCKYCGHDTLMYYMSEKAHVCPNCYNRLRRGETLTVDLFFNQEEEDKFYAENIREA